LVSLVLLAAACGGGGAQQTPTPELSPSATLTADEYNRPVAEDWAKPRFEGELGGIKLWSWASWAAEGRSLCASKSLEGPYFGPVIFSIRDEELPQLTFPAEYKLLDIRVCKDDITALGYVFDDAFVVVADGPHEWPVDAPTERVTAGSIAGRPAIFVAPTRPDDFRGTMVIVAEEFGLSVVTITGTLEEAKQIAERIDREDIHIPQGKGTFTGILNGIRLYDGFRGDNRKDGCLCGNYGLQDPDADGVEIPPDTSLDIFPSYLPEGYSLFTKRGTTCGGAIDLVEAQFSRKPGLIDLGIWRLSGEPAWYSVYSEDWLTGGTIAGRPAVFIFPPAWVKETDAPIEVVVREDFGLTVVTGHVPLEEAKRVAEGLNR